MAGRNIVVVAVHEICALAAVRCGGATPFLTAIPAACAGGLLAWCRACMPVQSRHSPVWSPMGDGDVSVCAYSGLLRATCALGV